MQGKIPYKFVDFDLRKVLFFNDYEKTRLGLGVYSNERLLKHASFGGFAGYGFGDKVWKYGGEISLELSKYRELEMRLSHQFNLKETGYSSLRSFESQQFTFRDYLAYQLDEITEYKADLGFRSLRYLKTKIHLSNVVHSPKYNYFYKHQEQGNTQIQDYTLSNIGLEFKFAYKERLIQAFNQRVSMGTKYPVLYLSYTRGLKDVVNGMFDYDKIEMRIEKELLWKRMGRSRITLDGGYISSPLPYGSLFTGEGSNNTNYRIYFKNSFQTLSPYEFLSDRYFNMYFIHDFGSLLFKTKKFKPSILVHQNIGWGTLRNTSLGQHQQIEFKTKEKGFFESGLQLDNLIRTNYLNIGYIGFGVGVFYRYGPYSRAEELNNFVLKISASFSSR